MAEQCPLCRQAPLCQEETFISPTYPYCLVGLYRTSFLVRKSGTFLKPRLSGNRTFSLLDAGLFKHYKNKKKKIKIFFFIFFFQFFIYFFSCGLRFLDTKFVSRDRNISLDSVRSSRTCPYLVSITLVPSSFPLCGAVQHFIH